jgi:cytochrome c oxidase subunit IV
MGHASAGHHDEHHEGLPGGIGHVSSWQTLVKVFVILVLLTVLTVAVAQVDAGRLNIVGAVGIAAVKAFFVCIWFMHLRYDKRFNFFLLVASLLFVIWMVGFILLDTMLYQRNIVDYQQDQKYAPDF